MLYLMIVGLACLTNILIEATPFQMLKSKYGLLEKHGKYDFLVELLNCAMCLGFWVGFIYFINYFDILNTLLFSSITSILAEIINKNLKK